MRVDFGDCSAGELSEIYGAFARVCMDRRADRALLKAGDDHPPGHYALRDALHTMAAHAAVPADFKLALMASSGAIEAVFREAQQHLRAAGFNAWVFGTEPEALAWLQGRAHGLTVS